MKLVRYGNPGEEKPGIVDEQGHIRDLSQYIHDLNPLHLAHSDIFQQLKNLVINQLPVVNQNTRLGACISMPGKILCVGFNTKLHAQQMEVKPIIPSEMLVFMKPSSAVCGPNDPILYAPHMQKLDWEAELGIVIGKKGKYITKEHAHEYILGYTCINDLSERYLQLETVDSQYTKGKGFDSAAPIGPYLVTKDEVLDSSRLQIKLWVNGVLRQDFNSSDYIHNDEEVICYLSKYFTLHPGDIISMGSGPGGAKAWGDQMFLKPNDKITLAITGLGQQEQMVINETISKY